MCPTQGKSAPPNAAVLRLPLDVAPYIMRSADARRPRFPPAFWRDTVRVGHVFQRRQGRGHEGSRCNFGSSCGARFGTGEWSGSDRFKRDVTLTIQSDQGDQPLPITIVQDGESLTASGEVPELGPIEMKGTLDGSDVLFEWDLYIEGMELSIVFSGTIAEDGTISGTADFGGFGEGGWSAKRVED